MPVPLPNPVKTNPLGQFADEAVDAAKSIVSPKQILESILGKSSNSQADIASIENLTAARLPQDQAAAALKQQQVISQRQADDRAKAEALLRLHRQQLQAEEMYFKQSQQQVQTEKQQQEQQEKQKKNEEVKQLTHEKQKEDVLGSMIKQFEGSKETKAWGAG